MQIFGFNLLNPFNLPRCILNPFNLNPFKFNPCEKARFTPSGKTTHAAAKVDFTVVNLQNQQSKDNTISEVALAVLTPLLHESSLMSSASEKLPVSNDSDSMTKINLDTPPSPGKQLRGGIVSSTDISESKLCEDVERMLLQACDLDQRHTSFFQTFDSDVFTAFKDDFLRLYNGEYQVFNLYNRQKTHNQDLKSKIDHLHTIMKEIGDFFDNASRGRYVNNLLIKKDVGSCTSVDHQIVNSNDTEAQHKSINESEWHTKANEILHEFCGLDEQYNTLRESCEKESFARFDYEFNEWCNLYIRFQNDLNADSHNKLTENLQCEINGLETKMEAIKQFLNVKWRDIMQGGAETEFDKVRLHLLDLDEMSYFLSQNHADKNYNSCIIKFENSYFEWQNKCGKVLDHLINNGEDVKNTLISVLIWRIREKVREIELFRDSNCELIIESLSHKNTNDLPIKEDIGSFVPNHLSNSAAETKKLTDFVNPVQEHIENTSKVKEILCQFNDLYRRYWSLLQNLSSQTLERKNFMQFEDDFIGWNSTFEELQSKCTPSECWDSIDQVKTKIKKIVVPFLDQGWKVLRAARPHPEDKQTNNLQTKAKSKSILPLSLTNARPSEKESNRATEDPNMNGSNLQLALGTYIQDKPVALEKNKKLSAQKLTESDY